MAAKKKVKKSKKEVTHEEGFEEKIQDEEDISNDSPKSAKEHALQLQRLQEKDPEFYEFLKEHDKDLLDFDAEDDDEEDEDAETDINGEEMQDDEDEQENIETDIDGEEMEDDEEHGTTVKDKEVKTSRTVITSAMVDTWCTAIKENSSLGAVRSLMKAFRTACHYGDDGGNDDLSKLSVMPSHVFNKIMLFVLNEMDGVLRGLLSLPSSGGKKETVLDVVHTRQWKNHNHLVKSYLGNALHVLNQMTDTEMISFTLKRLRYSTIFLAAFPSLLRKYIKVGLHFWGTGGGALPVVSFLFLRDLCVRIGSDCVDDCFKGIYKAYVLNCQFVNAKKLQHIQFLGNCVIEIFRVDLSAAYQHAFLFIRQLAMILKEALTMKTKESFRKVYEWKYINCLELWTGAICAYSSEAEFSPLAYPLTQIISGVARLVPTARYFPLRLRCARMLNRIAGSTGTFIPVALLLLDMLDMKEFNRPPAGGVGKSLDLRTVLKVSKPILKTRSFQEACVNTVIEELTEHLAQWSYSIAFFELSFVPAVRLRNFCKSTKVDRFRREMRHLIRQIEANSEYTNVKRMSVSILPNDPAASLILEDEKKSGSSPLSQYAALIRQKAKQKRDSLTETSVIVGEDSAIFGSELPGNDDDDGDDERDQEGGAVFNSSSWLPGRDSKAEVAKEDKKKRKKRKNRETEFQEAIDEDVVEELIISSDEDEGSMSDSPSNENDVEAEPPAKNKRSAQQKPTGKFSKKKAQFNPEKSKKRKKAQFNIEKSKKRKKAN
ncbi:hypothetical protein ACET3Z_025667 [Daucus carota]